MTTYPCQTLSAHGHGNFLSFLVLLLANIPLLLKSLVNIHLVVLTKLKYHIKV